MAKNQPVVILTQAHYDAIQAALARLKGIPAVIAKARKCGVNCDEYDAMHQFATQKNQELLTTWFPKGRPES